MYHAVAVSQPSVCSVSRKRKSVSDSKKVDSSDASSQNQSESTTSKSSDDDESPSKVQVVQLAVNSHAQTRRIATAPGSLYELTASVASSSKDTEKVNYWITTCFRKHLFVILKLSSRWGWGLMLWLNPFFCHGITNDFQYAVFLSKVTASMMGYLHEHIQQQELYTQKMHLRDLLYSIVKEMFPRKCCTITFHDWDMHGGQAL